MNDFIDTQLIADFLYKMAADMDFNDYQDQKENIVNDLENTLYKLRCMAYYNDDIKQLLNILNDIANYN